MVIILIFFGVSIITFFLTMIFYFLRSREVKKHVIGIVKKLNTLKFIIFFSIVGLIIFFVLNLNTFVGEPKYISEPIFNLTTIVLIMASITVFYNTLKFESQYIIKLDYPSRSKSKGTIKIGKVVYKDKAKHNLFLKIEDLECHMFVCGSTGSGKSNFLQKFLLNFSKVYGDIPFLLTEFKGEYQYLQKKIKDLLILKPGENFGINIFNPEGTDPRIHSERVFEIFESGGLLEGVEYSAQMERCFIDILNKVCPKPEYRNWEKFYELSNNYSSENRDSTFGKSVIAIQNRIRRFSIGSLKKIFVHNTGLSVKEIFNHRILLDLSSIIHLGGEKQDALFFLNMILKYMWDRNLERGSKNYTGIKHITIIEDAQYFAPEELSNRTKLTSYFEDIALLLRGTGECLISLATRPKISKEILANCGVLISFQNHIQKDLIAELLNLSQNQKEYLSQLKRGQCIIRINSIEKPFVLQTKYIQRSWLTDDEIVRNNQIILERKLKNIEGEKG